MATFADSLRIENTSSLHSLHNDSSHSSSTKGPGTYLLTDCGTAHRLPHLGQHKHPALPESMQVANCMFFGVLLALKEAAQMKSGSALCAPRQRRAVSVEALQRSNVNTQIARAREKQAQTWSFYKIPEMEIGMRFIEIYENTFFYKNKAASDEQLYI